MCPRCGSARTRKYWSKPGVGYEGDTTYYECCDCGHHWHVNKLTQRTQSARDRRLFAVSGQQA